MKNRLIAIISLIIALSCVAFSAFRIGVREGIRRAIEESKIYLNGEYVEVHLNDDVYVHIPERIK